jgi:hypothetical protein
LIVSPKKQVDMLEYARSADDDRFIPIVEA